MQVPARFERLAFTALIALAVAIVLTLPIVPGHDVPQHLAYVRLIATWQTDPHALSDVFSAPDVSNAYSTLYRLLAPLARLTSPESALRVALVAYVVLLSLGVRSLVRATWSLERAPLGSAGGPVPLTSLLGPVFAFNPILCMGLLPYLFSLVPFVWTCARAIAFFAHGRRRDLVAAASLAAVTAALHGFAAGALLVFLGLLLLFRRERRSLAAFFACGAAAGLASRLLGGAPAAPPGIVRELRANQHTYGFVDGFLGTFRVSFTHRVEKLEQVIASVLGPFPLLEKVLCAGLIASVIAIALTRRRGADRSARAVPGVHLAIGVFALLAIDAPAAVQVPDDLSLIDFRLITTATLLALATIPPLTITTSSVARRALALASAFALLIWARQLRGNAAEVMQTVRLVDHLGAEDRVLALPMHDSSDYLDERNAVLHYSAVEHTARNGGVTSLFWGRFSPRLPIGYRAGREPAHPFDWAPWELQDEQLQSFSHVLVRWPTETDDDRLRALGARVRELGRRGSLEQVACDGACCLFAVARPARAMR